MMCVDFNPRWIARILDTEPRFENNLTSMSKFEGNIS